MPPTERTSTTVSTVTHPDGSKTTTRTELRLEVDEHGVETVTREETTTSVESSPPKPVEPAREAPHAAGDVNPILETVGEVIEIVERGTKLVEKFKTFAAIVAAKKGG